MVVGKQAVRSVAEKHFAARLDQSRELAYAMTPFVRVCMFEHPEHRRQVERGVWQRKLLVASCQVLNLSQRNPILVAQVEDPLLGHSKARAIGVHADHGRPTLCEDDRTATSAAAEIENLETVDWPGPLQGRYQVLAKKLDPAARVIAPPAQIVTP